MRLLGIDCATKSLAVSIVDFNENWQTDLKAIQEKYTNLLDDASSMEKVDILQENIQSIKQCFDSMIQLEYVNVFDLLPGMKVKEASVELRMSRLKAIIHFIKNKFPNIDKVLVEYQMSANDKSRNISTALIYAFAEPNDNFINFGETNNFEKVGHSSKVEMVGPSLKSKVYFGAGGKVQNFRKKYMNNYTANKSHSKYNLLKWLEEYNCLDLIKNIPKKNLDDVADSFLMTYAWCLKEHKVC
jgi:hypothetical protein